MNRKDHRAIYIHCDSSMMPDANSSGGTGYVIKFPDELGLEDVINYHGTYADANIARLEMQGIIQGMKGLIRWLKKNQLNYSLVSTIIVITDRFNLQDCESTNPYKIADWKKNGGKNFEGKEIINWDLINTLDKTRNKLRNIARKSVRIEWRRRKFNKEADKLSKKGRKIGQLTREIAIEGHKIGRRRFDGDEIKYDSFAPKETLRIHIFRKRPIKEQWEINAEICTEKKRGQKLKIITDHLLQEKLQRGNEFDVRIKKVYSYHLEIFRTFTKIKKNS